MLVPPGFGLKGVVAAKLYRPIGLAHRFGWAVLSALSEFIAIRMLMIASVLIEDP